MRQTPVFLFICVILLQIVLKDAATTPGCGEANGLCTESDPGTEVPTSVDPKQPSSTLPMTDTLFHEVAGNHSTVSPVNVPTTQNVTAHERKTTTDGDTASTNDVGVTVQVLSTQEGRADTVSLSTAFPTELDVHQTTQSHHNDSYSAGTPISTSSSSETSSPSLPSADFSTGSPEFPHNAGFEQTTHPTTTFWTEVPWLTTTMIHPTIGGNGLDRFFGGGGGGGYDDVTCGPGEVLTDYGCNAVVPTTLPPRPSSTQWRLVTLTTKGPANPATWPKTTESNTSVNTQSQNTTSEDMAGSRANKDIDPTKFRCPHIVLENSMFHVADSGSVVLKGGRVLNENEFRITSAGDLRVCVNAVQKYQSKGVLYDRNRATVVLTNLCLVSSQVCLLLTFILHCFCPKLRTLPGYILMFLASSLFMAHSVFFFFSASSSDRIRCTAIGVVLHYFWLASFSWLNICSFHTFRVFWDVFSSRNFKTNLKQILLKYCIFGYGVPAAFVATTIAVNHLVSGGNSIGYGSLDFCFLSPGTNTTVGLLVPAGLTVLVSLTLFILTLIALYRASASGRKAGRSDTWAILRYIKLSSITGFSWIFGFLQLVDTNEKVFPILFIVLTGAQGVFIFLAFMVNKRVYNIVTACCRKEEGKKYSVSTTEDAV